MLNFLVATLLDPLSQPDRRGVRGWRRGAGVACGAEPSATRSDHHLSRRGVPARLVRAADLRRRDGGEADARRARRGLPQLLRLVLAGNQRLAKAVAASSVPRSDLFICGSVVSNRADTFSRAYELTKRGCQQNEAFAVGGIKTST